VTESDNPGKDANQLIARVDALMKRQQEDSRRAGEEVPLLTEIVAQDETAAAPEAANAEKALAADIERVLLVRLVPVVNKQIASLRSELEKGLRRSVRDAVEHALAERKADPRKPGGGI
jgi:hypothetical protein